MKRAVFLFLSLYFACVFSWGAAMPVSRMQNAVSGVTQSKMAQRGFASNDPRWVGTLASTSGNIAGAAATAATVTALGVTAPAWVTVAAGFAVGAAVSLALEAGIKWIFKDPGNVQIGDNPASINTPAGLAPPTLLYCFNTTCATSVSAACTGQPSLSNADVNGTTMARAYVYGSSGCTVHYTPKDGSGPGYDISSLSPTTKTGNVNVCPGTGLTASGGKCPASNFTEPAAAPVKTISDAAAGLTDAQKALPLNPQLIADLVNDAWKQAASAPGYNGLPYDATQPVTAADAAAWQASNPNYWPSVGDFVAPQASPSGGTAGSSPFSVPTGTSPAASTDPAAQPSPGTNPSSEPLENLGPDPGIGAPALEPIPTAQQILAPLLNLFPSLRNFVVPNHNAVCPKWTVHLFDRDIVAQDHCPMIEQVRPTAYSTMAAVWLILALFIVLAA